MRDAITAAKSGKGSREDLQGAAREMVRALRQSQLTPEKALLQIKSALEEAGLRPSYADGTDSKSPEAALYQDVIAWSIRAYYDGSTD